MFLAGVELHWPALWWAGGVALMVLAIRDGLIRRYRGGGS